MASKPVASNGKTIAEDMQRTFVSMVRLSGAFAFYGVENLQSAVSFRPNAGLFKAANNLSTVLDSMSATVSERMDSGNRSVADSAAKITQTMMDQSIAGFSLVDPSVWLVWRASWFRVPRRW
jgi:hypothetical protein